MRRYPWALPRLLGALLVVLVAAPVAWGHGGGGAVLGYHSTITSIRPDTAEMTLEILDGDDRLRLVNTGSEEIVVLGYEGEPYLRVGPEGVFTNTRSPATYLNEDRYGEADLPAAADAKAAPEWEKVEDEPRAEWHDHRIHWMSTTPPPVVQDDPDSPHHILDWTVRLEVEGAPVTVAGSLDYDPIDEGGFALILLAPLGLLVLVGIAAFWLRKRQERRAGAPARAGFDARAARDRVR